MRTAISIPGEACDENVAHHDPIHCAGGRSSSEVFKCSALGRIAIAVLILGIQGLPASADIPLTEQEIIERILELRSEAARLTMGLTPEGRAELERRLEEAEQRPPVETEPSPTAATPPSQVSPRVDPEPASVAVVPAHEKSQVATDSSPPLPTEPAAKTRDLLFGSRLPKCW